MGHGVVIVRIMASGQQDGTISDSSGAAQAARQSVRSLAEQRKLPGMQLWVATRAARRRAERMRRLFIKLIVHINTPATQGTLRQIGESRTVWNAGRLLGRRARALPLKMAPVYPARNAAESTALTQHRAIFVPNWCSMKAENRTKMA